MLHTTSSGDWFKMTIPPEWEDRTLDELMRVHWKAGKKLIHQMRMEKTILINGESPNWNLHLTKGDFLQFKLFQEEDFGFTPTFIDIVVLYEDEHLLVINKPAGMDTHPNSAQEKDTLANAVAFYLQSKGEFRKIQHIHRLDRDTTGAVLFAKHALAGSILDRMLEERKIKRTYLALAEGIIRQKKGVINKPIGRDRHHPSRRRVSPAGQPAVTKFKVRQILQDRRMTLVECQLETGRTHQIRVHFSAIGHPLAGDQLYGGDTFFQRQALHAGKLAFTHPFTAEEIVCFAPFIDEPQIFKGIDIFEL
ncbi:RluA family pseudouridine synthase [Bacillus canaveralius]|uniref:Pseudouridine synthase n=1 Tax=Bacillus canaveralius TaxID=1403243 RepID=A0A2N5GG17_9BACI|nr:MULTISPECIES: RluA family pseudouridine synthase [Bacillus]PLR79650.1 RluA family pseudouridine synthase [Bacillus canaveralius]PLR80862.1 RluA family pseudouridine synthase [Bacillus sp. V33-4]PLS00841.1 RluA family pseudouridine synthase [Bacillus canaveralius]RSK53811.1 RluA family pseudouridine synthase [Bacillus canaveralius]